MIHTLNTISNHQGLRILVVGCGGNGSAILAGLPYLHSALLAWGHPKGLIVTVVDGDTVSATNCVRQPFGMADIGTNKAVTLVNRLNMFHGLNWEARATFFTRDLPAGKRYLAESIDIVISCVDSR